MNDFEVDTERAEQQAAEWCNNRLARAERFCRITNVDPNDVCPGILKDFADLEQKDLYGLLDAFALRLSELGKQNHEFHAQTAARLMTMLTEVEDGSFEQLSEAIWNYQLELRKAVGEGGNVPNPSEVAEKDHPDPYLDTDEALEVGTK
jgi:hypothetical protein